MKDKFHYHRTRCDRDHRDSGGNAAAGIEQARQTRAVTVSRQNN